ncbi:hypothetical protein P3X46_003925 [Hevea brasiliensis]|uniref:DUF4005 domain-containing protein n=1 Tax=Hevea brasiliensis TaxID=3981 RepID=A0ABQ9N9G5_HEVBR|nr:uncharacterized protein LOC110649142 [Hevea brasiliensis]KAJ9188580.1 hypothetical protein P3X46_003925 [Hevea brasiliensis]
MRCKKHPCDLSSTVGVCASCLRERLIVLIAAQAQVQQIHHHPQLACLHSSAAVDDSRKSDAQPPPIMFPRSVSPYVARRKSDDTSWSHHLRFYSTPQMGPTYNSASTASGFATSATCKAKPARFSRLSNMFRSRSEKFNPDPSVSGRGVPSRTSCQASSSSPSWLSAIFSGRRKKQSALFSEQYSGVVGHKPRRRMDRGMSPARGADSDDDCEDCNRSPSGSGSSSESSQAQWWKRTPVAPAAMRRGKPGNGTNVSGLAFCLSPLLRASPNRHWNQKGGLPPDMGFSGEARVPVKPHLSVAASFYANRSRKLCDFGRVHHNR